MKGMLLVALTAATLPPGYVAVLVWVLVASREFRRAPTAL